MVQYITKQITYYKNPGPENTSKTIGLTLERAAEGDINKVVVATSSGDSALKVIEVFKKNKITIVPVTLNAGSKWSQDEKWLGNEKKLKELGISYYKGVQAFSGVERGIFEKWKLCGPTMLISDCLRISGEGFKVAIEVSLMATDAGLISSGDKIIAMAGTSLGLDTALILRPALTNNFFSLAVNEIICKPFVYGVKHEAR